MSAIKDSFVLPLLRALKPPPLLTVSDWAEERRFLSTKSGAAEPGRWRNKRTPYLSRIMDCLSPSHPCNMVVFMKGSQIGATEAGSNWIGHTVDLDPCIMMMVQTSIDTAKRNSKIRIRPLFDETPSIRDKISNAVYKDSGNTMLQKEYEGGSLVMCGSKAAGPLRSTPAKKIFFDEVDGYDRDVEGEGSVVDLGLARLRTHGKNQKSFLVSTPTEELNSIIAPAFEDSSQEFYHVPCPHCREMQRIDWGRIKWDDKKKPKNAYLECLHCREKIPEHHKTWMLEEGAWIAINPDHEIIGFHLSALYSPLGWYSWTDAAKQFVAAKNDPSKMKTFVNTVLGETWKQKVEVPDYKRLMRYREKYRAGTVPAGGFFITQGVDVQKDRLEVQVRAWGRDHENWLVDYSVLDGDTSQQEVWKKLAKMIDTQYEHENGQMIPVSMTAIDAGYNTQHVYNFCRKYSRTRVIPVKGSDSALLPISMGQKADVNVKSNKKIKRGVTVYTVGSSIIKSEIYSWLRLEPPMDETELYPSGFCHHYEIDEEFFKQMTAERLVEKTNKNGFTKFEWVCLRRNEVLDTFVYARAAAAAKGIDRMKEKDYQKFEIALGIIKKEKPKDVTDEDEEAVAVVPKPVKKAKKRKTKRKPIVTY